jgi:hypothetical protein
MFLHLGSKSTATSPSFASCWHFLQNWICCMQVVQHTVWNGRMGPWVWSLGTELTAIEDLQWHHTMTSYCSVWIGPLMISMSGDSIYCYTPDCPAC